MDWLGRLLRRETPTPGIFPLEVLRDILTYADAATLAACSGVSYALLEIAYEILYQDVEVVGVERLRRLFNETVSSGSSSPLWAVSCVSASVSLLI